MLPLTREEISLLREGKLDEAEASYRKRDPKPDSDVSAYVAYQLEALHYVPRYQYILDENHRPVPAPSLLEWGAFMEDHDRRVVKHEMVDQVLVSTVFLGIDHNWLGGGEPILWETMCFDHSDVARRGKRQWSGMLDYQERYRSHEEALAGHEEAVAWVKQRVAAK